MNIFVTAGGSFLVQAVFNLSVIGNSIRTLFQDQSTANDSLQGTLPVLCPLTHLVLDLFRQHVNRVAIVADLPAAAE